VSQRSFRRAKDFSNIIIIIKLCPEQTILAVSNFSSHCQDYAEMSHNHFYEAPVTPISD